MQRTWSELVKETLNGVFRREEIPVILQEEWDNGQENWMDGAADLEFELPQAGNAQGKEMDVFM